MTQEKETCPLLRKKLLSRYRVHIKDESTPDTYWFVLGSTFDENVIDESSPELITVLSWLQANATGNWYWCRDSANAWDDEGNILDLLDILWIKFDLKSDAMLSRLTWLDLRGKSQYAFNRGLSREAG